MGGLPLLLVKGCMNIRLCDLWARCLMSEVDCSASTSLDSSIVFISHLQSVLCLAIAITIVLHCCSLERDSPLLFFSSSELDAALVVQPGFSTAT